MSNVSSPSIPTHSLNKPIPIFLAVLVGISLIGWLIQIIKIHFQPRRLSLLILLSHLTLFIELILRAVYSNNASKTRFVYTISGMLLAISHRTLILGNYEFIIQLSELSLCLGRTINLIAALTAVSSAIIMSISSRMLYNSRSLGKAFVLRQIACALVFSMVIIFYAVWFVIKHQIYKTKQTILLLIISSSSCLIITIYLVITSIPNYYFQSNESEYYFYIFQTTPHIIALFTWSIIYHSKRNQHDFKSSVVSTNEI